MADFISDTPPGSGDVVLPHAMPQAEYMYGCAPTSVAMLLGYYDLYGCRGRDFSNLIEGDVELESRGTDGNKFNMNAFDTALGLATASRDYVYRFVSRTDLDVIIAGFTGSAESKPHDAEPTTPEEELPYSFVNDGAGPEIRTDLWNCIADYLGTGQFWRGNANYDTESHPAMLERIITTDSEKTVAAGEIERSVDFRYMTLLYGLYLYVRSRGYALDMKVTEMQWVDVNGGHFTFDRYKAEIDAGRPMLVIIDGHIMTGYGYNAETKEIIFDDCYTAGQRMVWDGFYHYAQKDRCLKAIVTVGLLASDDADIDLAVAPVAGAEEKLIFGTAADQVVSSDCCFAGDPLYLSFGAANLGASSGGPFDAWIFVDDERKVGVPGLCVAGGAVVSAKNILVEDLDVGLHTIRVALDPDNTIPEAAALNNSEEASLMVLAKGTTVVRGIVQVASGEVSRDDYVMNGAELRVLEGGTAERTLIQGKVTGRDDKGEAIFTPGVAKTAEGGVLRDAVVYEYGRLQVSGTAENVSVLDSGEVAVSEGGAVDGISVDEFGKLTVESGARLTGRIRLNEDAVAVFEEGSRIDFDLTQTAPGGEALVTGFAVIRGAPSLALTLSDSQRGGVYALADGAEGFEGTVSVASGPDGVPEALAVGDTLSAGSVDYTLALTDDLLALRIADRTLPADPVGTPNRLSWGPTRAGQYTVECSTDDFGHVLRSVAASPAVDLLGLPDGTWRWRVRGDGEEWAVGDAFAVEARAETPQLLCSNDDGCGDVFFAGTGETWDKGYTARNVGSVNDWSGTGERIRIVGKNRIADIFEGSSDANILVLTDDAGGDALFLDDIYTELPDELAEQQSRIARIDEIRAGAGDDVVDMTSRRFEYTGDGVTVRGGDGDDVIWANKGDNFLFGDAGNDRLVGASGNDVLAGGSGDDRMHGGGGEDLFTFGGNWGADTVEQLADGSVTLWFASGTSDNWDAASLTYADGDNSVTVSGVSADRVTLKFGDDGSARYAALAEQGAFAGITSEKIFEEKNRGMLASL